MGELLKVLYSQEYPQNVIQEAIRKATSTSIENIRASKAITVINNLVLVTTFNPNNTIFPLIQTAFKSLQQWSKTKECFKHIKLIKTQRKSSHLKKLLTRAIHSTKKDHCSKKCTKIGYACCDYIKQNSFHTFKTTGDIFYLKEDLACESSNLVYVVISGKGKQGFEIGFEFLYNTYINRNINILNARNTFERVDKENSKYFVSSNNIPRINTYENNNKNIFKINFNQCYTSNLK